MAQSTFSCPFGAIHLEDRRGGDAAEANSVRHDGLPPVPHFTGAANADWFSFYYRCR